MNDINKQFEDEYGLDSEPDAVDLVVAKQLAPQKQEEDDPELLEVEKAWEKYGYYKVIVKNGVVIDDGSPEAAEVNAEGRLWARQQMAKLFGRGPTASAPAPTQELFNQDQVNILREIADRTMAAMGSKRQEPQVVRNSAPGKKPGPQPMTQAAVTTKQKPQPQARQVARPAPDSLPRKKDGSVDYDAIETGKTFVDDNGEKYKFVDNPRPSEGSPPRVKLKVSGQVRGRGVLPMPSQKAQEIISQSQAMNAINIGGSANMDQGSRQLIAGSSILTAAAAVSLKEE